MAIDSFYGKILHMCHEVGRSNLQGLGDVGDSPCPSTGESQVSIEDSPDIFGITLLRIWLDERAKEKELCCSIAPRTTACALTGGAGATGGCTQAPHREDSMLNHFDYIPKGRERGKELCRAIKSSG